MKRTQRNASSVKAVSNDTEASCSKTPSDDQGQVCHFDKLPDAALTRIFRCLHLKDLVKLRQVCRKWGCFFTTPPASELFWQDCQLSYETNCWGDSSSKTYFWKCWRMAPVLHRATFEIDWRETAEFSERLLEKCPSTIKSLYFFYDNMPPEAMFTLFKKYGNTLEQLIINDTMTPYVDSDVKRIWTGIQNMTKLQHLVIDGAGLLYYKAFLIKAKPCWQTLKILDVKDSSYEEMNTVQKIISMHHNWTQVYLSSNVELARGEVKALSKCTELESAQVPFCKEFKFLLNCEKLDSLIIDCTDKDGEIKQVVTALEKKPSCFPNLTGLKMIGGNSSYVPLLKGILKGSPRVRLLNFVNLALEAGDLTEVLGYASGLEKMFLHEVGSDFLDPVLNELADGLVPTLKKVLLYDCHCEDVCVKVCVNRFNEKQLPVKIITDCTCNPSEPSEALGEESVKNKIV